MWCHKIHKFEMEIFQKRKKSAVEFGPWSCLFTSEIVINSTHGAQHFAYACDYILPVCIVPGGGGGMLGFLVKYSLRLTQKITIKFRKVIQSYTVKRNWGELEYTTGRAGWRAVSYYNYDG